MRDRISNLPDAILQHILSLLPMKSAVATSILSTGWRCLWTSTPVLDFGETFGIDREPEEIAGIINRFLNLHNSNNIQQFRLCFHPGEDHYSDAEDWIELAIRKGVRELDLDFSQGYFGPKRSAFDSRDPFELPDCVYDCGSSSLESLKLCLCDLNPTPTFTGFSSLQTLHLTQVSITTEMVESLISRCPVLENLSICHCFPKDWTDHLKISGPDLPLKRLKMVDSLLFGNELEIFAPNLVSFEFCGEPLNFDLREISCLIAAVFDFSDCEITEPADFIHGLISELSECVEVLTVCSRFLKDACYSDPYTPYTPFHNLKELQLLMDGMSYDDLFNVCSFLSNCPCPSLEKLFLESVVECGPEHITPFHNLKELQLLIDDMTDDDLFNINYFLKSCPCPSLEKLFLQISNYTSDLLANEDDESSTQLQEPFDYNFDLLKTIKIKGFKGLQNEIRFVKIFLEKAIVLGSLILIVPHGSHQEKGSKDAPSKITRMSMDVLHDQLLLLPKACSYAKIVISEQDDIGLCRTYTDIYTPSSYKEMHGWGVN